MVDQNRELTFQQLLGASTVKLAELIKPKLNAVIRTAGMAMGATGVILVTLYYDKDDPTEYRVMVSGQAIRPELVEAMPGLICKVSEAITGIPAAARSVKRSGGK